MWCFKRLFVKYEHIYILGLMSGIRIFSILRALDMADCLSFIGLGLAGGGGIIFDFQSDVDVLVLFFT